MTDADLSARAQRAGVAAGFHDAHGKWVEATDEALERILAVLEDDDATAPAPPRDSADTGPLPHIPRLPEQGRMFGWQVQLYQLIGSDSWGIGDYRDLALAARSYGGAGADVLLVNPLHAMTPPAPGGRVQPSPYFPSSRRFNDQLAVSVERLPEYSAAPPELQAKIDSLRPPRPEVIDRDAVWAAKRAAFALLAPPPGELEVDPVLAEFGVFCALAEVHGGDWRQWPEELRRPGPAATMAADPEAAAMHAWLQVRAREQLLAAQADATRCGMRVGLVHDLAVGVDPGGADGWQNQDALAAGFTIGAPPDTFNQLGQDWGLPPWRPDRLAASGFAPFREVVRAALSLGGGLRVDHVMGLFRLWWVPEGLGAADGAYVHYDGRAMMRVVAEEAAAAGAVVIGEDLGTVADEVRDAMAESNTLGSAVLWFTHGDDGRILPPQHWREAAAASISTHDLPTAHGQQIGEPGRVRHELGQLGHSLEVEQVREQKLLDDLYGRLRDEGLLAGDPPYEEAAVTVAMHRYLFRTPSRLVLLSPADAVGDTRQPNLPGTVDEYPNWRLPLADRYGTLLGLEAVLGHPGTAHLAAAARAEVRGDGS